MKIILNKFFKNFHTVELRVFFFVVVVYQKMYKWIKHLLYPDGILFKKLSYHAGTYTSEGEKHQYKQTQLFSRNCSFQANVIFSAIPDLLRSRSSMKILEVSEKVLIPEV